MEVGRPLVAARPHGDVTLLDPADPELLGGAGVSSKTVTAPRATVTELELETVAHPSRREQFREELRWPLLTYGGTRLALLLLAIVCDVVFGPIVPKTSIAHEIGNWDGYWYIRVATLGYPAAVSHAQTTLGFFPLYSMVMWLVSHVTMLPYFVSGLVVSLIGGFVATVIVQRLATEWWGPDVARKAVLLFCLFPGSVVFSMDYSEGLLIPLAAGCMLALSKRRWLLAGVLAGFATAIGPDSFTLIAMCAVASLVQLRRYGWRDAEARRSLVAPLLAPAGAVAFALFLKLWTGSFLASFIAQKDGWNETTTPFAIPATIVDTVRELFAPGNISNLNLNNISGILGAAFLLVGLRWLWRDRFTIPIEVWAFVGTMTVLMCTSAHVPPNPRMLITAFPVVLIFAKWVRGRAWTRFVWAMGGALIVMSTLTYVGSVLRP
ncbi:MAG TPA: mannosyltransferase family protein [Acidimicrobiales bacterium]|nr:mannosyltransferase family protein [Acidimicrobiales bacterium]